MNLFRLLTFVALTVSLAYPQVSSLSHDPASQTISGFSIVGYDPATGDLGIAFESNILAAGGILCYARTSAGAIAVQGYPNPQYGTLGLQFLEQGMSPRQIMDTIMKNDSDKEYRQIGIVDSHGNVLSFTGNRCPSFAKSFNGINFCVQGNLLPDDGVLDRVARVFQSTEGELSDRLLTALDSGSRTGSHSAGLLLIRDHGGYGGLSDHYIDLRVDGDSLPVLRLRQLYTEWQEKYYFDARWHTIDAFMNDKKFDNARAELKRVVAAMNEELRRKPDDPETLNRIAFALSTHDVDRPRALELAKRASLLSPNSLIISNTLAECYYQVGQFDEAISIESQLVAKEPTNVVYWNQLKKFKEARERTGH